MTVLEQRTIEIIAQVVYKEICIDRREGLVDDFWKQCEEETLELARNIIRVNNKINHSK